jgi:hypothetical protein
MVFKSFSLSFFTALLVALFIASQSTSAQDLNDLHHLQEATDPIPASEVVLECVCPTQASWSEDIRAIYAKASSDATSMKQRARKEAAAILEEARKNAQRCDSFPPLFLLQKHIYFL